PDPGDEFDHAGDYWRWKDKDKLPDHLSARPLFTMGSNATISFGIVIVHHSVPLAIALENMWQAEAEAKEHKYIDQTGKEQAKDAVQVRVIYGNGNILKATSKFDVFAQWQQLVNLDIDIANTDRPALFEQAAKVWDQHPVPVYEAIDAWCVAFCDRREKLNDDNKDKFRNALTQFIEALWIKTKKDKRDEEIKNWLKLAAFILRKRDIKIKLQEI
ncbi:MAG: type III-B CRISPR-associated protein Cas10/Cmr2, partial [Cyanobacteria bacterium M5B4]